MALWHIADEPEESFAIREGSARFQNDFLTSGYSPIQSNLEDRALPQILQTCQSWLRKIRQLAVRWTLGQGILRDTPRGRIMNGN